MLSPDQPRAGLEIEEALQRRACGQRHLQLIVRDDWPPRRVAFGFWLGVCTGLAFGAAVLAWTLLAG